MRAHHDRIYAVLRWCCVALSLVGFQRVAGAGTTIIPNGTVGLNYVTGGVQLVDGPGNGAFIGRTFADPSVQARTMAVVEQNSASLAGRQLTVTASRTVTAAEVGVAAVAVGAAFYGGCVAGTEIAKFAGMGTQPANGSRVTCNVTDWLFDEGQPSTTSPRYCGTGPRAVQECAASAVDLQSLWMSELAVGKCNAVDTIVYSRGTITGTTGGNISINYQCGSTSGVYGTWSYATNGTMQTCPASIDALNPAWSIPAGSPPGADGKCATGRYNAVSPEIAGQRLGQYGDATRMKPFSQWLLDRGATIPVAAPRNITGVSPASATSAPITSTQTNADGSTVTTTKTPTTTFTASGDTVTYSTTYETVTQTCTGANSCSTTTTNTTTPGAAQEADQKSDCDKHPNAIGCSEYGTPSTEKVTGTEKPVSFTPVSFGEASCPAPVTFEAYGTHTFEFAPMCDAAVTWVRPVVLVIAAALGAFIFIGGLKS